MGSANVREGLPWCGILSADRVCRESLGRLNSAFRSSSPTQNLYPSSFTSRFVDSRRIAAVPSFPLDLRASSEQQTSEDESMYPEQLLGIKPQERIFSAWRGKIDLDKYNWWPERAKQAGVTEITVCSGQVRR